METVIIPPGDEEAKRVLRALAMRGESGQVIVVEKKGEQIEAHLEGKPSLADHPHTHPGSFGRDKQLNALMLAAMAMMGSGTYALPKELQCPRPVGPNFTSSKVSGKSLYCAEGETVTDSRGQVYKRIKGALVKQKMEVKSE